MDVHGDEQQGSISWLWVGIAFVVFVVFEVVLGALLAPVLDGAAVSRMLRLRLELVTMLLSFFGGGVVVGFVSPGERMMEPAIGAALSVFLTFTISWFYPSIFFRSGGSSMLLGMGLGFGLALYGAHLGERWSGNDA